MYGTEKCLWVRLFEVVFAHLKAGSDQRQVLTSSQGNAAWTDQYTEQDLSKKKNPKKPCSIIPPSMMPVLWSSRSNWIFHARCVTWRPLGEHGPLSKPTVHFAMIFLFLQGYWLGDTEHLLHFVENCTKMIRHLEANMQMFQVDIQICKCNRSLDIFPRENYVSIVPSWRLMISTAQLLCKLQKFTLLSSACVNQETPYYHADMCKYWMLRLK